jgi:hypothetical protein
LKVPTNKPARCHDPKYHHWHLHCTIRTSNLILSKKLYEKCLLNIPCNFSIDFMWHPVKNLEKFGINMNRLWLNPFPSDVDINRHTKNDPTVVCWHMFNRFFFLFLWSFV